MSLKSPLKFNDDDENKDETKELLDELGMIRDEIAGYISIQKANGGYIDQVRVDDVRQLYGTLPEYLKAQHGPGEYIVTVSSASGKPITQRMRIAGEGGVDESGQQQSFGMEGQDSVKTLKPAIMTGKVLKNSAHHNGRDILIFFQQLDSPVFHRKLLFFAVFHHFIREFHSSAVKTVS